jgi:hypothetical protein
MITFNTTPAAYFAPHWPLLNRPMTFLESAKLELGAGCDGKGFSDTGMGIAPAAQRKAHPVSAVTVVTEPEPLRS